MAHGHSHGNHALAAEQYIDLLLLYKKINLSANSLKINAICQMTICIFILLQMKMVIFSSVPPSNDAGCCMTTTSYVQAAGGYTSDNKEYVKIDTCADDPMIDGEMSKENEEVRLFKIYFFSLRKEFPFFPA